MTVFSSRMNGIEQSGIRKMFDMSKEDSINLGLGEPDFQPPQAAIRAVVDAMEKGFNKYGPTNGLPQLREAISRRIGAYWRDAGPQNVIVTNSGTEGLFSSVMTFVSRGEGVLIPNPGFVLYRPQVMLVEGVPVDYTLMQENDFRPDPDEISRRIDERTKALIINSPNNPTGGMITRQDRDDLVDIARDRDIVLISDEVYDSMVYPGNVHHSFLGKYEKGVVVNSFSKIYAMTGWRLGYLVAEEDLLKKISLSHYHMVACPPTPIQYGAIAGLKNSDGFVDMMVTEFKGRRDMITERLNEIPGFNALSPPGTFYSFPSYELFEGASRIPSSDLAIECAKNGMICSHGTSFGSNGEYHLRFSFVNSRENIQHGMDILESIARRHQR
jgi:aspartate aminotransferase